MGYFQSSELKNLYKNKFVTEQFRSQTQISSCNILPQGQEFSESTFTS